MNEKIEIITMIPDSYPELDDEIELSVQRDTLIPPTFIQDELIADILPWQ